MDEDRNDEILDRLTRIETRLAQLMVYVGASVTTPNKPGGLLDFIESALEEFCGYDDE